MQDCASHIPTQRYRQRLSAIDRVRRFITKDISLNLYKSLVLQYLDYVDLIYQHTSVKNLVRVQMIQDNACCIITRDGKYANVLGMHLNLELRFLANIGGL